MTILPHRVRSEAEGTTEETEWERLQVLLLFTVAGGLLSLLVLPSVFSTLALLCWFAYAMKVQNRRDAIERATRRDANIATLESELGIGR